MARSAPIGDGLVLVQHNKRDSPTSHAVHLRDLSAGRPCVLHLYTG